MLVAQPHPTLCDPMDCSPSGCSVHGILQERTLEWVAISFSRGSSPPRDGTQVSCTASRFFRLVLKFPKSRPLPLEAWAQRIGGDLQKMLEQGTCLCPGPSCSAAAAAKQGGERGLNVQLHLVTGLGVSAPGWETTESTMAWPRELVYRVAELCTWSWASRGERHLFSRPLGLVVFVVVWLLSRVQLFPPHGL